MDKIMEVDFDGHKIRSIKIDGEVWFVAKDAVEGLGGTWDKKRSLKPIPDEWVKRGKFPPLSGSPILLITEQAFYILAYRGNHPKAIEFSRKIAQFTKDMRQGNVGQTEFDQMQSETQLFFGFFSTIPPQREVNHKRNNTPELEGNNGVFWNKGHELIGKMNCRDRKAELIKRGAPVPLVNRSGLDGLRWFEDTYWESIPHSLRAQLALRKYPHQQMIPEVVSSHIG